MAGFHHLEWVAQDDDGNNPIALIIARTLRSRCPRRPYCDCRWMRRIDPVFTHASWPVHGERRTACCPRYIRAVILARCATGPDKPPIQHRPPLVAAPRPPSPPGIATLALDWPCRGGGRSMARWLRTVSSAYQNRAGRCFPSGVVPTAGQRARQRGTHRSLRPAAAPISLRNQSVVERTPLALHGRTTAKAQGRAHRLVGSGWWYGGVDLFGRVSSASSWVSASGRRSSRLAPSARYRTVQVRVGCSSLAVPEYRRLCSVALLATASRWLAPVAHGEESVPAKRPRVARCVCRPELAVAT